jgi:hypothetical protein
LETEIRIREGVTSFSVAGNQVNTVYKYIKTRNAHFESNVNLKNIIYKDGITNVEIK